MLLANFLSRPFKNLVSVLRKRFRRGHPRCNYQPPPSHDLFVYQQSPWDEDLDPWGASYSDDAERYASVADLCTHVGSQLPIQLVKLIARDVLRALEELHDGRVVAHCDLNTSNIVLSFRDLRALVSQLSAASGPLRLGISQGNDTVASFESVLLDFNSMLTSTSTPVFRLSSVDSDRFGLRGLVECRSLRAPEVILGAPHGTSADIWNLGCIIYELLAGDSLFDPLFQTVELDLTPEESHLIQIIELFGQFPPDLLSIGEYSHRWFTDTGTLKIDTTYYSVTLEEILKYRIDEGDVSNTADFLRTLLQLSPQRRARAQDIISHPWFTS
ncbi:Serine/threonine-protein kinase SKY1 [Hypsizygus marmoreus]|uniref:non-specific serine/threonine protein kinase n=1 Tax=Hypsizygus marmoreus TaxID=39966 RepID=A0A369JEX2_HYPMA|nr:Serine/threonine-protein kinase SKY1 [Hypsizygus marmoreus]